MEGDKMNFTVRDMSEDYAIEILNWRYEFPYDFYNNEVNPDSLKEMLGDSYFIVLDQHNSLIGFFCTGDSAQVPAGRQFGAYSEDMVDLGIGMKPELTGQGHGTAFFAFVLRYAQDNYEGVPIRLTVAKFNERAIHLYEKFGFVQRMGFNKDTTRFITMMKE